MPDSWRKNGSIAVKDNRLGNYLSAFKGIMKSHLQKVKSFVFNNGRVILPVIMVSSLVVFQKENIVHVSKSVLNGLHAMKVKLLHSKTNHDDHDYDGFSERNRNGKRRGFFSFFSRRGSRDSSRSQMNEAKIDLKAYNDVVGR
jgi:hypothetical protein